MTLVDLTRAAGPASAQGGHASWSASGEVTLGAGTYLIGVEHENVTFPEGDDGHWNHSVCNFSIGMAYVNRGEVGGVYPIHVNVVFTERSLDADIADCGGSLCKSGYVFRGTATLVYNDGSTRSYAVQSGGWVHGTAALPKPTTDAEIADANANPQNWADTCCPPEVTGIHTFLHTGSLTGFQIDSENTSPLRTHLKLHVSSRTGSEGCLSTTNAAEWAEIVEEMEKANSVMEDALTLNVVYACGAQPQYSIGAH